MAQTFRVFQCAAQSDEAVTTVTLSTREYGTCAQGTGSWQTITVEEGGMSADVVSLLIVVGLCIAAGLGWIGGHQR